MRKPHIEKASDVNGGQYVPHNPAYNNGYEDGKKAGKEYCASEITLLREQVEKLKAELASIHWMPLPKAPAMQEDKP